MKKTKKDRCQRCGEKPTAWAGIEVWDVVTHDRRVAIVCRDCRIELKPVRNFLRCLPRQFWDEVNPPVPFARLPVVGMHKPSKLNKVKPGKTLC